MSIKYIFAYALSLCGLMILSACCPQQPATQVYQDGTYRGIFIDGDAIQVNVQIELENGIVTAASFRHLRRDDDYHLEADQEPYKSVIQQYQEALDYLIGKDIATHLNALYTPEKIVTTEVDGYTAATLRSNKILSAIRDALNRGPYSL